MNKADRYMVEAILNILNNGYKDINPRPHYADGTPAHTLSVNHVFRTYDLSKGEFPICSLRPMAWKTGIKEIFTIYQKPTNEIAKMEEMGVNWWGDWDIGDGTIGQRYGATVSRYDLINNLIKDIEVRLSDKQIKIKLTDKAKDYIIDNSYDEAFGARPIKRYIVKNIESLIANSIIEDKIRFNSTITIDVIDSKFVII